MHEESVQADKSTEQTLPDSVYISVVRSLYAGANSLAIGILCAALTPVILFAKTGDAVQLYFGAYLLIFGVLRLALTQGFYQFNDKSPPAELYKKWEDYYTYLAAFYVAVLGIWYFVSILRSTDPFVQLYSLSMVLCYMIGIIGRNFASEKVVTSQTVISGVLIISGTVLTGEFYQIVLAIFLLPFLAAIHMLSKRLRNMLLQSELAAVENKMIADRFDVALDNVTHGIGMFDRDGKIVVANERFMKLSGLADWEIIGSDLSILLAAKIKDAEEDNLAAQIENCLRVNESRKFTFRNRTDQAVEADYNSMAGGGVVVLSDISERMAAEKAIRDLANFDPLTSLPNRRFFVQEIERKFTGPHGIIPCSMFFIDLDKFKEVNDTMGHAVGDALLTTISSRLKLLLNRRSMICRFGGDEFVVIVPNLIEKSECSAFADKIIQEMSLPVIIEGTKIDVGASIGIATAPYDGKDAEQLLQYADAALYEAKAKGRMTYRFYTDDLGESIRFRRELEQDLRMALQHEQLDVYYQPLLNLARGKVTTCEALTRWTHPKHGRISPEVFIQIAEEAGLISELGHFVLRRAMYDCKQWPEDVRVAVNVSSIQFQRTDVCQIIKQLLAEVDLPADKFEIEVTESAMLHSMEEITATLEEISALGVRISLDDFGTGFSSLSYLHTM
ncbi:MAG: EAL domain-containing protein, partial [Pseudomonadota bacterium]